MKQFDLLIKNGTIYTAVETFNADIAVKDEKITAIGQNLGNAERVIDAEGMLVLPGGIDAHCHIEQESSTKYHDCRRFLLGQCFSSIRGEYYFLTICRTAPRTKPSGSC